MDQEEAESQEVKWTPLERQERRVLGVLIEKAKTTPDNYPLSLNSLKNGCNQKSNRYPQMDLEEEDVEEACEGLRKVHAIGHIEGGFRTDKFRHIGYDWMGVNKEEIAVMAELLLRGAQTVGELRARAARMESIAGQTELRPILENLLAKNLVIYLTPPGRGAIITHNLYQPREMEKLQREHGGAISQPTPKPHTSVPVTSEIASSTVQSDDTGQSEMAATLHALHEELATVKQEVSALRAEVAELRSVIE